MEQSRKKIMVRFTLNGEEVELLIKPWQTLLEVLRDELYLTGTKEGCSNGNCGACTVIFDNDAIDACITLGAEAEGHDIVTIEGMASNGRLHPIQEAMINHGGLQCGFCTPGFIMSAKAFIDKNPKATEQDLRLGLAGNLCRCTGYDKIIRALQSIMGEKGA